MMPEIAEYIFVGGTGTLACAGGLSTAWIAHRADIFHARRTGRSACATRAVKAKWKAPNVPHALAARLLCDYNVSTRSLTVLKVELVRVGNSRGIRIPKPIIEQCGFEDIVELRIENDHLVIAPARLPREGWEKAFLAAGSSLHDELLLDTPSSQFDWEEWRW